MAADKAVIKLIVYSIRNGLKALLNFTGSGVILYNIRMKLKSVRIIAGQNRSRKIIYGESGDLRPTPDRVRENLFNILQNEIPNAAVLDLFAGTGAFGFEALSRGADYAVFADKSGDCIASIKRNIEALKIPPGKHRILHSDYLYTVKMLSGQKFDIIFADPPFDSLDYKDMVKALVNADIIDSGSVIIVETAAGTGFEAPDGALITDTRNYGAVKLHFIKKQNKQ